MEESRVSVALCTHNGARFIREQLRSILAQSRRPNEIVVSDDDSTDDTLALVRDELAEATRSGIDVSILTNVPARGVTRNFERAMLACTGELIVLSDQDDRWHPDRLERMIALFDREPALDLAFSDARLVDASGAPLGDTLFGSLAISKADKAALRDGHAFSALMKRNLVTGATVVVRRRLLERAAPFPAGWVHDEWLAIVAAAGGHLDYVDDALIDYRQHGDNQIGARSLGLVGKLRRLVEPGAERNDRLFERASALEERLPSLQPPVPAALLAASRAKMQHEAARIALPAGRLRRVVPILREWRTGRYGRYGRGGADAVRDLVQPR